MEAAADLLDPKETTGMVVYVGDGWPSVGDLHANEIRARLSRRPGGTPRLKTHRAQAIDLADIRKRWASKRVQELALRSRGREAVTDVALREKLLTPWTGWTLVSGSPPVYQAAPMKQRVLHLK